ncbi:MAG: hypothetical protein WCO00_07025 [Rhodospirillaceae bacterium]
MPLTGVWRATMAAAALTVYGLASAPAPPEAGAAEIAIALLLIAATGLERPAAMASGRLLLHPEARRFETVGAVVFVGLLWVPLLRGAALDWSGRDILRDLVPLLYLFLPVLLVAPLRVAGARAVGLLVTGLTLAGLAFALRWWTDAGWAFGAIGHRAMGEGPGYLLNSPAVQFAALWLPFSAIRLLWPAVDAEPRPGRLWLRLALPLPLIVAALLIGAALAGTVHRMALLMIAASGLGYLVWCARRTVWPLLVVLLGLAALLTLLPGAPLPGALGMLVIKSQQVGVNERANEVAAVLDQTGRSWTSLLIGDGWGTLMANPAVGGWRVSYTHSFPSYLLLKTGLLGLLLMVCWLATLAPAALRLARRDPPLAFAALPPLAGGLLVHTSFKYLCFGLLLTLVTLAAELPARGEDGPALS